MDRRHLSRDTFWATRAAPALLLLVGLAILPLVPSPLAGAGRRALIFDAVATLSWTATLSGCGAQHDSGGGAVGSQDGPPPGALNVVTQYGAHGDGVTDDADHIQAAIDALGTSGGDIYFPPAAYKTTATIKLPAGNTSTMTLWGYGATIEPTGCLGFLEFNDSSQYLDFQHFTIRGFEVDATNRSNVDGCSFLGATNAWSRERTQRGNVQYIEIRDCYIHGAPAVPGGTCTAICLGTKTLAQDEEKRLYVRHIDVDNVTVEGGDTGILVLTDMAAAGWTDPLPNYMNAVTDDVNISNFTFDSGKTPPFAFAPHVGIQIGGTPGLGGTCNITDCYLKGSEDDLIEIDNMMVCNMTRVTCVEAYNDAFLIRGFGYTLDADPPSEGSMVVNHNDCFYDNGQRGAQGVTGFGYAWDEINPEDHPTYHVYYTDCSYKDDNGDTHDYTGP